jgi:hypothetical protein
MLEGSRSKTFFSQPTLDAAGQEIDIRRLVVEAGDLLEGFPASLEEGLLTLATDFLKCLQAVCHERRAYDQQALLAFAG